MKTMLNGRPTEVTPAKMLEILIAETRVQVCLDLKRMQARGVGPANAERVRLTDELQALDELANEQRAGIE